jgi:CheY-like chemotaxis protein
LGGDENILLVDDEQTVRDIANRMLSRQGYGVMQADCGENALSIYQEHSNYIDLVILDLGMPGMGGKACLSELRRIDPQAKVLIASGYIQYENSDELSELGAAGLVAKPYRKNDFFEKGAGSFGCLRRPPLHPDCLKAIPVSTRSRRIKPYQTIPVFGNGQPAAQSRKDNGKPLSPAGASHGSCQASIKTCSFGGWLFINKH